MGVNGHAVKALTDGFLGAYGMMESIKRNRKQDERLDRQLQNQETQLVIDNGRAEAADKRASESHNATMETHRRNIQEQEAAKHANVFLAALQDRSNADEQTKPLIDKQLLGYMNSHPFYQKNFGFGGNTGRQVVGIDMLNDGRMTLRVHNQKTGTTGPSTKGRTSEPDDEVEFISMNQIKALAGKLGKTDGEYTYKNVKRKTIDGEESLTQVFNKNGGIEAVFDSNGIDVMTSNADAPYEPTETELAIARSKHPNNNDGIPFNSPNKDDIIAYAVSLRNNKNNQGAGAVGAAGGVKTQGSQDNPFKISTKAEYEDLPAGTYFINPSTGNVQVKR
jgi:hypothetical protein